jgi:hypothetical protein
MPPFFELPDEAAIVGRLLAGYGDLEYDMAGCARHFTFNDNSALRAMFRARSEHARIEIGDSLIRDGIAAESLGPQYDDALGGIRHCRKIRNQYAHCHWLNSENGNLRFLVLEEAVAGATMKSMTVKHASKSLLDEQESYFRYTQRCFWFLDHEIQRLRGKLGSHAFSMPTKRPQPILHSL